MSSQEIENGSLYYFQCWKYQKGEHDRSFYLESDPDYEAMVTDFEGYFVKPHNELDVNGGPQKISEFLQSRLEDSPIDTSDALIVFATQQDCTEIWIEEEGFTPETNSDLEDGEVITNYIKDGKILAKPVFQMLFDK